MARIITSKLQHFDPMARGGEQVVTRGGPKFAKTGLFGGDMDINELNSLNAAIKSGMGIAKDVWPTIKGVVDPPMKKIQEMMQQSDIEDARSKAAKGMALKAGDSLVGRGTPPAGQEIVEEDITEVETKVPMGAARQGVNRRFDASLSKEISDSKESMLAPLYEKYRISPGDKQGLASALMRAKEFAGATARPIAQRDVLEDEKTFVQALSSTGERGEPGSPLSAYQGISRDNDAARSASVKSRAIDAARSRGTEQYRSGNYEDAARSMLSAYRMDPESTYLFNAGKARLKAGDLAGAKDMYTKAAMTPGIPSERKGEAIQIIGSIDSMMPEAASQPARPAAPMPSATGVPVTPLQARTSGAPMRSASAPAGQRAMRPLAQAAPAAPTAPTSQVGVGQMDKQLLTDPTNRAFVRTVLAEMKGRGQEEDLGYAMDQLRLEIAKRGTKAPTMIDESVREVLTMDPGQASSGMDMMGMYALADQSTVADWPKIEPIARRVIAARPRGFLELVGMEDELLKVYNRLGKPGGTPGVEFDLKGISERGLKGAQALKARGKKVKTGSDKSKGSVPKSFHKYVNVVRTETAEGVPQFFYDENEAFHALPEEGKSKNLRQQIRVWMQRKNRKSLGIGTAGQQTPQARQDSLKRTASAKLAGIEARIRKTKAQLNQVPSSYTDAQLTDENVSSKDRTSRSKTNDSRDKRRQVLMDRIVDLESKAKTEKALIGGTDTVVESQ